MSLVVSINGIYHSYFDPKFKGSLNKVTENTELMQKELSRPKDNKIETRKETKYDLGRKIYSDNEKHGHKDKKPRTSIFARDIMQKDFITIGPKVKINEALSKMNQMDIHHLLVFENDHLVGIISDRDLLRGLSHNQEIVKECMSEKVLMCEEKTELRLMAKAMLEEKISSLPVINSENALVGIITKSDLLVCIVKNMPLEVWV